MFCIHHQMKDNIRNKQNRYDLQDCIPTTAYRFDKIKYILLFYTTPCRFVQRIYFYFQYVATDVGSIHTKCVRFKINPYFFLTKHMLLFLLLISNISQFYVNFRRICLHDTKINLMHQIHISINKYSYLKSGVRNMRNPEVSNVYQKQNRNMTKKLNQKCKYSDLYLIF